MILKEELGQESQETDLEEFASINLLLAFISSIGVALTIGLTFVDSTRGLKILNGRKSG